jgi:predicted DNA-binding transcriptional regulator AlpA
VLKQINKDQKLLSEGEVATILGLDLKILQKLRISGKAPKHIKITTKSIRYVPSDIVEWIDENKIRGENVAANGWAK